MQATYENIQSEVTEYLNNLGVTFEAKLIGESKKDNWVCDEWRVSFKRGSVVFNTEYFTGTGHRKPIKGAPADKGSKNTLYRENWEKTWLRPVAPKSADVLYSLILDSQAIDESFNDWAQNFGYDTDSRKALSLYEKCCDIGRDMRKLFTHDERAKITELTQDL